MKRWPILISILYVLTLIVLSGPLVSLVFLGSKEKIAPGALSDIWQYWVWIAVLALNQWVLLALPVAVANKRPASRRAIIFQIIASAFSMGLLIAGLAVGLGEVAKGDFEATNWIFLGALGFSWLFWAYIFSSWSRKLQPQDLVRQTCQTLFRGSVLQLLIVVPSHIYVRGKDYCCAGYATAIGIACGLAIMLLSFGPSIYFLYDVQRKKLRSRSGHRVR